jgi:folate-binding protein YgfZ
LVTNDIAKSVLTYTALLTPQGKYLADFFVLVREDDVLIDVAEQLSAALKKRLIMYRLRADVQVNNMELDVSCGFGKPPTGAFSDPRLKALGWRHYGVSSTGIIDWAELRVEHLIPETGIELQADKFILEMRFEHLNGVDFKKGCYVGQEITARMKHKMALKKGIIQVKIVGSVDPGTPIIANGKPAGIIYTQSQGRALAYLRFDRIVEQMTSNDAKITI